MNIETVAAPSLLLRVRQVAMTVVWCQSAVLLVGAETVPPPEEKDKDPVCVVASVRLPGMKPFKGARLLGGDTACIVPLPGHVLLETPTLSMVQCCGGRCKAGEITYETPSQGKTPSNGETPSKGETFPKGHVTKACVSVEGWIEDKWWGGGACAKLKMCAKVGPPEVEDGTVR